MLATTLLSFALCAVSAVSAGKQHVPHGVHRRHHHVARSSTKHCNTTTPESSSSAASHSSTASAAAPSKSAIFNVGSSGAKNVTKSVTKGEYNVVDRWAGANFFDGWNFFTNPDPTHGQVTYVSESKAKSANLAYVDKDGVAVMKVDSTSNLASGAKRDSVRIYSEKKYDSGLFIADIKSMPFGCAVWPAFWTVGPNWPAGGEIDIIEGVHNNVQNQATLHTSAGCSTDTSSTAPSAFNIKKLAMTSELRGTACHSGKDSNTGCAFIDSSKVSYGKPLNDAGGAVFAMLLSDDGIKIWNFPRDSVPDDITSQAPSPSTWDTQFLKAAWGATTCPTSSHFKQHNMVFDITLLGDWAGASYKSSGCPGTGASQVMKGSNFETAQWEVNSVTVYQ